MMQDQKTSNWWILLCSFGFGKAIHLFITMYVP